MMLMTCGHDSDLSKDAHPFHMPGSVISSCTKLGLKSICCQLLQVVPGHYLQMKPAPRRFSLLGHMYKTLLMPHAGTVNATIFEDEEGGVEESSMLAIVAAASVM